MCRWLLDGPFRTTTFFGLRGGILAFSRVGERRALLEALLAVLLVAFQLPLTSVCAYIYGAVWLVGQGQGHTEEEEEGVVF